MNQRHVPFSYYFKLSDKRFSLIGTIFTLSAIFFLLPFIFFLRSLFPEGMNEDYSEVKEKGVVTEARVTYISRVNNVTINNIHPRKISFRYKDKGVMLENSFSTLDREIADTLKTGSKIPVKVYKGKAAIIGVEEVSFPFEMFFILPAIFFIIGSVFAYKGYYPAIRRMKLLKTGTIKQGHITTLLANQGLPVSGVGRKLFIYYYYFGKSGSKIAAEDTTPEMELLAFYKPEDIVTIVVDPENENNSCLVPLQLAKLNEWKIRQ